MKKSYFTLILNYPLYFYLQGLHGIVLTGNGIPLFLIQIV